MAIRDMNPVVKAKTGLTRMWTVKNMLDREIAFLVHERYLVIHRMEETKKGEWELVSVSTAKSRDSLLLTEELIPVFCRMITPSCTVVGESMPDQTWHLGV